MRLAAKLRQQIRSGELAAGAKIPALEALAAQEKLNRQTVGKALGVLAAEGLAVRAPGNGYFVAGRE